VFGSTTVARRAGARPAGLEQNGEEAIVDPNRLLDDAVSRPRRRECSIRGRFVDRQLLLSTAIDAATSRAPAATIAELASIQASMRCRLGSGKIAFSSPSVMNSWYPDIRS
jgi:hypothetical protein